KVTPPMKLCAAPPVVGPCRAAFQRWFYNDTRGRCQKFIYGGCRGNKNNHESEEQCSSICAGESQAPDKVK
uniref:BPTI/Kunitz inhibitor domain-containing protein n=1 Tax=Neogobius melanostomus TaxID=47308 RepID=A0A8C6SL01_9GOBI